MRSLVLQRRFVLAALAVLLPAMVTMSGCASTEGVEQQQVYEATNGFAVVDPFTYDATVKAHKKVDLSSLAIGDVVIVEYAESLVSANSNG
jgi:hypothetical protein